MATSNDISWELDRDDIIASAYRKLGIPGEGNTLSAQQILDGAEALNGVISLAVTDGMALWKRTTVAQTPSDTTQVYTIEGAIKVAAVFLRDNASGTQYELIHKSLYDMNILPRSSVGVPVNWTFQPTISGGTVSIWPLTSDADTIANKEIIVVYQREFDGFTAGTETLDFPAYWHLPIVYRTAQVLAAENGIPINDRTQLLGETKLMWKQAADYGDEDGSYFIMPHPQGRHG